MNRRDTHHRIKRCTIFLIALLLGIAAAYGQDAAPLQPTVDEKTQTAIIDSATAALNDAYVFPDVAKKMEQLVRNNLKNLKRGTIIGEVTGGGAHPVNIQDFPTLHISLQVPYGRAINPITKTNWECTGVTPDINVPADQALTVARIEALKKIMDKEQNPTRKKQLAWAMKSLEPEKNPVTLDAKMLASLDNFRIRFDRGAGGEVTRLVGMYDDGTTDANPRTNR